MKKVYVHGLGQTSASWDQVVSQLAASDDRVCINLADLLHGKEVNYSNLYNAFAALCNSYGGQIDLCGLSLGGVLSLNYAIDYPQKVHSMILIAAQYKMPKRLLQFQNMVFRFMPNSMFKQMGFDKSDFIRLCKTMAELDFSKSLAAVSCRTLVICGEKDSANLRASTKLADYMSNAELHTIGGAGHELNTEAPEILAEEIRNFYRV